IMNEVIAQKLKDLPSESGVYIMLSSDEQILYVGKAKSLKNRVRQYFQNSNKTIKTLNLVAKIADFKYIITNNEIDALVLENNLIKQNKPPYNILLKDDKSYPFFKINLKQKFPKFEVVRKLKEDGAKYFGPYMQGISAKEMLDLLHSAYPLPTCSLNLEKVPKNHRPCLNYHIKRCNAPCCNYVTQEEYFDVINQAINFLNGNDKNIKVILTQKMMEAAQQEEFETALFYKEKLQLLDKIVRKQITALPKDFNLDVFSIASNGLHSVAYVLYVRAGKLLGSYRQILTDIVGSDEGVLSNFIVQHYNTRPINCDEILTHIQLDDASALTNYISEKAKRKINVLYVQSGIRKQLCNMAFNNAQDYLEKSLSVIERQENMSLGAVTQLQEMLKLKTLPLRMECYDISNISGTDKVASMVVFTNGEIDKTQYRRFKIKTVEGVNDFESMYEVIKRRFAEAKNETAKATATEDILNINAVNTQTEKDILNINGVNTQTEENVFDKNIANKTAINKKNEASISANGFKLLPDLVVIDGGLGQLKYANRAMAEEGFSCQIISLAEREDLVYILDSNVPIALPRNSYALKLLQRLRDEAHRFAITFHKKLRLKRQTASILKEIEGIGDKKIEMLYEDFKNINAIKKATVEQLCKVKGISLANAQAIYNYFNND
ncbi:MAG: excinuclease ABC subunit UvrC, partial [Clostridia bacterium]